MNPAELLAWVRWAGDHFWYFIGVGLGSVLLLYAVGAWFNRRPRSPLRSWGSATWASHEQMRSAGLFDGPGVILGEHEQEILRASDEAHVVLIGPTRGGVTREKPSGKGVSTVIPTLLTWPESVLVIDVKQELYDITSAYRETLGPVYRVNFADPTSHRANLCYFIRSSHAVADTQRLAESLVAPSAPPTQATEYWRGQAADLATTGLLFLQTQPTYPRSFSGLRHLMLDGPKPVVRCLAQFNQCADAEVRAGAQRLLSMTASKRGDVWDSTLRLLTPWRDPIVCQQTDATDVPWHLLQQDATPMSVYLQVSSEDLRGRLRPVFRVLLEQLLSRLIDRPVGSYRHALLIVLDEFAALGHLAAIEQAASLVAGYGIRLLLVLQSLEQLWEAYGQHTGMLNNCSVRILFAPNSVEDAQAYETLLGVMTVEEQGHRLAGDRFMPIAQQHSTSLMSHARPLVTTGEWLELGAMTCVIRVTGIPPIRARKLRYYDDPRFLPRLSASGVSS